MNKDTRKIQSESGVADDVLREVWRIKDELSASYGHDLHRLFREARERQRKSRPSLGENETTMTYVDLQRRLHDQPFKPFRVGISGFLLTIAPPAFYAVSQQIERANSEMIGTRSFLAVEMIRQFKAGWRA
jgi:hypothetical protein